MRKEEITIAGSSSFTILKNALQHSWNAFKSRDQTAMHYEPYGYASYSKPDRVRLSLGNERSIVSSLYNRIALDVAAIEFRHVRVNQNGRYEDTIDSHLNECLTLSANLDQTSRAFIQDVVMSMFDEGCVCIVPVDTTLNPKSTNAYDVNSLRCGRILEWYPEHVRVSVYNEHSGQHEELMLAKSFVVIIENPLYAVMNEPNSTLKRLVRKMNLLDGIDEQSSSGKLDLIIQLPYTIKNELKRQQVEQRKKDIEMQLTGSRYGIAYIDATERVTQLNRPADNNLMSQIEYLTNTLYNQLGISEKIFDGTANEQEMLNYHNRTIEPIVSAICMGMTRTFLSKTARTQGQRIMFFRDPFKLVPVNQIADIADKFTRNEIFTSNEVRAIVGQKPSDQPGADELRNKNLNQNTEQIAAQQKPPIEEGSPKEANANEV